MMFETHDGVAWSCDLYLNGTKSAHVFNPGDGGYTRFHWLKPELEPSFQQYVKTTPHEDGEALVCHLCDQIDTKKRLKRLCSKKTVVKMKGSEDGVYSTFKTPFTPQFKDRLVKQYGDQIVEFVNETVQ
jgi:hypothetical protein